MHAHDTIARPCALLTALNEHVAEPGMCTRQASAHRIKTLREVQPLIERSLEGPNGGSSNGCAAAVEQHLHEGAYSTAELEEALGTSLRQLFEGNSSQLRVLEIAESAGGWRHAHFTDISWAAHAAAWPV